MGVEVPNINVFNITPLEIEGQAIRQEALREAIKDTDFVGLPVIFKVGKAEYTLGTIHAARVGRDNVFIDTVFQLEQKLEYELTVDENGKPVFKPLKIVYKKE